MGGDEFLILCPEATADTAQAAAERHRRALEENRVQFGDLELALTATFGVVQRMPRHTTVDDLLKCADDALYAGKRAGANCVSVVGCPQSSLSPVGR